MERGGGVIPHKLSGTGSVKERERDFAEPGSAGPPPPPRAPAAGAEFSVTGCAVPRRPRPARAGPRMCTHSRTTLTAKSDFWRPGPARAGRPDRLPARNCQKLSFLDPPSPSSPPSLLSPEVGYFVKMKGPGNAAESGGTSRAPWSVTDKPPGALEAYRQPRERP